MYWHFSSVLQTILIQQKIIHTHNQHSILTVMWRGSVFCYDDALEKVAGHHQ